MHGGAAAPGSAGVSPHPTVTDDVPDWAAEVDARGLLCPLPVLRARKALAGIATGQVLRLLATDPAARIDLPHFCATAGHEVLAVRDEGGALAYYLRRGG